jgi:hypothetical protein
MTVVPIDGDSTPSRSDNRAKIGRTLFPANAVANFEESRLFAGHVFIGLPSLNAMEYKRRWERFRVPAIAKVQ